MDDKKKFKSLKLYITGFGAFGNILTNPTTILVNKIKENKSTLEEIYCYEIKSAEVLKVTMSEAERYCQNINKELDNNTDKEIMHLNIHFGVAASRDKICLEFKAKNEFNGTDVDGVKKNGFIAENCGMEICCRLDLNEILKGINRGSNNQNVEISHDAGTYLCNYIYYHSETNSKKNNSENVFCVFIHVPILDVINEEAQYEFFSDFINQVKEIYLEN